MTRVMPKMVRKKPIDAALGLPRVVCAACASRVGIPSGLVRTTPHCGIGSVASGSLRLVTDAAEYFRALPAGPAAPAQILRTGCVPVLFAARRGRRLAERSGQSVRGIG